MTRYFVIEIDEEGEPEEDLEDTLSECLECLNLDMSVREVTKKEEGHEA